MRNELTSIKKNQLVSASDFFKIAILIITGIVLPLILIPIIKISGFSEIIEEIAKTGVVLFLILGLPSHKAKILAGIVFGFLFGMSENILYLNNIFQLGDFSIFWQRFLWTVPMHIVTVLVIVFAGLAGRKWIILGLAGAIILHLLFNSLAVSILI